MFEGGLQSEKDVEAEGVVSAIPPIMSVFSACVILPVVSYLSHSLPCHSSSAHDHPNAFTLAQVASAKEHRHLHISPYIPLTEGKSTADRIEHATDKQHHCHMKDVILLHWLILRGRNEDM